MSIEKITSKIINDARAEKDLLLAEVQKEQDEIMQEAQNKCEEIKKQALSKGEDEKKKLVWRRKSVAEIDGKKLVLEQKQALISECFKEAINEIVSMDRNLYVDFLADRVKASGETFGALVMNPVEQKEIGQAVLDRINEIIPGNKIVLSEETGDFEGGFLLQQETLFINITVETLVREAKEELVAEVANKLFSEE